MKKLKITKKDIGRWITVKWDDVGRRDSILVEVISKLEARVYEPYGRLARVSLDQIVEKRDFVKAA
jgi:hypothetical protein